MKANEKKNRSNKYELIAAISLGVLALGSFALQALTLSDKTTKSETVLFSTLQFLLTVGFGWFSTRAVSRNEFESSLKRFAVSAYRRVADIEDMVQRLQSKIAIMRTERSGDDCADLDIVGAIVEDTVQVVNSSMADWADVIGDELLAMQTIKHLETEKSEIKAEPNIMQSTGELDARVQEIDEKINELISRLPARLQYDTRRDENLSRDQQHAAEWMVRRHREDDGLKLAVIAGGNYKCEREPSTLVPGEILYAMLNGHVNIVDESGVALGRALNNSPLIYPNFANALAMCYGSSRIALEFVEIASARKGKGKGKESAIDVTYTWYKVKVIMKPVYRRPRISVTSPA